MMKKVSDRRSHIHLLNRVVRSESVLIVVVPAARGSLRDRRSRIGTGGGDGNGVVVDGGR